MAYKNTSSFQNTLKMQLVKQLILIIVQLLLILKCILESWDLGCKGITVFRDGCKDVQVLNIGTKMVKCLWIRFDTGHIEFLDQHIK